MIFRLAAASILLTHSALAGPVLVDVSGAKPGHGQILATLFKGEAAWMKSPAAEKRAPVDGQGRAQIDFGDHPAGTYGVSIVYDEDMDGELDLNLVGIPTEAFGFSNNAEALIGVPGWEKVQFPVADDGTTIKIRLDRVD